VDGQIFSTAPAKECSMHFRHVLEEPLDVRPLSTQLALLSNLAGFNSTSVVQLNTFGVRWRRLLNCVPTVVVTVVVEVIIPGVVIVVVLCVVVGSFIGCSEREIVLWSMLRGLLLLLLLMNCNRMEGSHVELNGRQRFGHLMEKRNHY
jgi:hypothetical protein